MATAEIESQHQSPPRYFGALLLCLSFCLPQIGIAQQPNWLEQAEQLVSGGDRSAAIELIQSHLQQLPNTAEAASTARAFRELGQLLLDDGQFAEAERAFLQAKEIYETLDDSTALARLLGELGITIRQQARYPEALAWYEQSLEIFRREEDLEGMGDRYNNIGVVLELMGQYGAALQSHEESLAIARRVQDLGSVSTSLYNIGEIWRDLGELQTARQYFTDSLAIDTRLENRNDMAHSHHKLGVTLLGLGDLTASREHLDNSVKLFKAAGNQRNVVWSEGVLGKIELEAGNLALADQLLRRAADSAESLQSPTLRIEIGSYLAQLLMQQGQFGEALQVAERHIELADAVKEDTRLAALLSLQSRALAELGDYQGALRSVQRQLNIERTLFAESREASNVLTRSRVEFNRQRQLIELLEKDNELQRTQFQREEIQRTLTMVGVVLGLMLIAVYFHVRWQRRTNERLAIEVAASTEQLHHKNQALEKASITDPLTGLGNRRMIERAFAELQETGPKQPWMLFLLDLDHFKRVNDRYGHAAGDSILLGLKPCMLQVFGSDALCSRWGGEEFLIACPVSPNKQPDQLAESLRSCIEKTRFDTSVGQLSVTVSIGFAPYPLTPDPKQGHDWFRALDVADACLYAAKLSSRNAWVGIGALRSDLPASAFNDSLPSALERLEANGGIDVLKSFSVATTWA